MKRLLRLPDLLRLSLLFLITLMFQNCTEQKIQERTDETLNITEYLRDNSDYSMFLEILDITNYASFMNTYGTYTLFLPTNEAVQNYMQDLGVSSLSEIPLDDLQALAKLHILEQKVNTTTFTDGKIPTPSMYGQYLITGASNNNDVSSITVNKNANIIASNIELGNGVVHVIDHVLHVANKTLAQRIEEDPNLSLFTEVLKATGWYEKLNQPITYDDKNIGSFLTVLAQTNEVYNNTKWKNPANNNAVVTLNTLENLKLRYSKPVGNATVADPTNPADSLNLYVQYRLVSGLNYLADFATTPVFVTKAPLEVISSKLKGQSILLNEDVFNGVLEEGVEMIRALSDETCSNGVLHYVDENFNIKKRLPSPVYFDVCDQPEFALDLVNYRKPGGTWIYKAPGAFKDITWTGSKTYTLDWNNYGTSVNGDLIRATRFRTGSGGLNNIEYTTPVIIKGRYKIWVSYRAHASGSSNTKIFFNGVQTSRILNMKEFPNDAFNTTSGVGDRVIESQGYKRYIFPFVRTDALYSRLVGIVDVPTTGRHKVMFVTDAGSNSGSADADRIDLIEFRPVDMDQIWPKFRPGFRLNPGVSSGNDLNGDYLIQRQEADKGDNGNTGK